MAQLDDIDQKILSLLGDNARGKASDMAERLNISASAVRRRITRLERSGVIAKYTAVLDHEKVGNSMEAYVELTFHGGADVQAILSAAIQRPEVREASTLAGDPDAIVRLRVKDAEHLRETVTKLRQMDSVTGSKTLVALGRMRHVAEHPES
jgi:Lrp/AsnC family leucine-responsive transcriptional regulator